MTTIIDHHRLLFFIGAMKAKRKKKTQKQRHKSSSSCLRGVKARGRGEDDDDHKSLSSLPIFHMNDEGKKQKT